MGEGEKVDRKIERLAHLRKFCISKYKEIKILGRIFVIREQLKEEAIPK